MNTKLKIRQLNGKAIALQNDLSQRTRNFLLHRGLKDVSIVPKADQYVQTDNYSENQPSAAASHLQGLSSAYESCYSSNQNQENTAASKINTSEFFFNQNQEISQNRQNLSEIIQQLKDWQRVSQQSKSEANSQENFSLQDNQPQPFDRQKRRLKREIKKLAQKLTFQQQISQIAKEALLISQEENYQFRLKIMELTRTPGHKEFQIQIDSNHTHSCWIEELKQEIDNLEENLNHERQLRGQHLNNSLQLQEQINRLIQENEGLRININQFQSRQARNLEVKIDDHSNDQQRSNQEILQKIKITAYSISNCIPITNQSQNINYFRPQTDEEVLEILQRAQYYCKQIERLQIQRIEQIARQKRLFVDVLNKISLHIDKQAKENIKQQLSKIEEMSHFISAFKEKEQVTSRVYSRPFKDYPIQAQKIVMA